MRSKSIILYQSLFQAVAIFRALTAWLSLSHVSSGAALPAQLDLAHNTQPIAWNELGAKATAQYSGDGLAVNATANGARLRCGFQKLEGEVTPEGLWLSSTASGSSNTPCCVQVTSVGHERGARRTLPSTGTVEAAGGLARFIRSGLVEEYSVSLDGLRQDFVLPERLPGEGALRVELKACGARAEATPGGARLVLENSGRKLNYHRLRATDATGRELAAWLEVLSPSQLAVVIEDGGALYPVRIDPTFSDANWTSMGGFPGVGEARVRGLPGLVDSVGAAVVDGAGNLYIGGAFTIVGDVFATNIAKWDGTGWSALGSGITAPYDYPYYSGSVNALAVSGSDLYVGGFFTTAGGIAATNIAKWNGSSWSAVGSGMNSNVFALAVSGSDLYAGGWFTTAGDIAATNIAKWNGSSWSALGSGMSAPPDFQHPYGGAVNALAVSGSDLYAGGWFTMAGGIAASNIAKWNGTNWSAVGPGVNGEVRALAVSGTDLYAGGNFTRAGGIAATNVARWNGSSWSSLGSGMGRFDSYNPSVSALAVSGGDLYTGGSFSIAGGIAANNIAKWNGSSWSALGSGINDYGPWVSALAVSGTNLYAGGFFSRVDGIEASSIAKWNGSNWSALGSRFDLYAAGYFITANGASQIAKWDGSGWSALGLGINGAVHALAVSGSNLYVGGIFTTAGGIAANSIAKWNGNSWSPLGLGIRDFTDPVGLGSVSALAVSGTNLYAGGYFTTAGDIAAANIAKWDGTSWSALGSGVNNPVYALAVSGNNLYAGGWFDTAGGTAANSIAKWDGSNWSALGSGMLAPAEDPFGLGWVWALAVSGSNLYAGGLFTTVGGIAASNIANWNGGSWSALGSGMGGYSPHVLALALSAGDLYAGGNFTSAGGMAASHIAKWNGSSWSTLGSGVGGSLASVSALAVSDANLFVGGGFSVAGGKVSGGIAKARIGSVAKSVAASSGGVVIQLSGVTGYEYDVQRATSLNTPITWTTVTTSPLSPADDGSFTFTDSNAPAGAAYYRAVQR